MPGQLSASNSFSPSWLSSQANTSSRCQRTLPPIFTGRGPILPAARSLSKVEVPMDNNVEMANRTSGDRKAGDCAPHPRGLKLDFGFMDRLNRRHHAKLLIVFKPTERGSPPVSGGQTNHCVASECDTAERVGIECI